MPDPRVHGDRSNGHAHTGAGDDATTSRDTLAQWLLTTEMSADDASSGESAAVGRVFDKLSQRLALLITPIGAEALLARAVHLSRKQFAFLDDIQALPKEASLIHRLREAAASVEPRQAHEGVVLVLATLIGLLESFIGQDLTWRLLGDVWPGVMVPVAAADANQGD
jgi:hypothetical protein